MSFEFRNIQDLKDRLTQGPIRIKSGLLNDTLLWSLDDVASDCICFSYLELLYITKCATKTAVKTIYWLKINGFKIILDPYPHMPDSAQWTVIFTFLEDGELKDTLLQIRGEKIARLINNRIMPEQGMEQRYDSEERPRLEQHKSQLIAAIKKLKEVSTICLTEPKLSVG